MKHLWKLVLIICAAGTWWFSFTQQTDLKTEAATPEHKINYFLKGVHSIDMTTAGEPKQRLQADYIQHFIDDDSTEVTQPKLTMYAPDKPNIHIKSETGLVSSDAEIIFLNGAVHIQRNALDDTAPIDVDTSNLRVQLDKNYAETDEFVTIKSGFSSIQGTGLNAYFSEPVKLNILHNVKGHHEIN